MKIEKIKIKNFRSFGEKAILEANSGLNIIIGENNVGKSNLFIALDKLKKVLISKEYTLMRGNQGTVIFLKEDFHCGKSDKEIEIFVSLILDEKEVNKLITLLIPFNLKINDKKLENFKKKIGNRIEIFLKHKHKENKLPYFKIGNLFLNIFNGASINPSSFYLPTYRVIKWENLIHSSFRGERDFSEKIKVIEKDQLIEFKDKRISNFIIQLFVKNMKIFEDIRQKPEEKIKYEDESIDGTEIAKLLFELKNSQFPIERERYKFIQKKFSEIFSSLNLEAVTHKYNKTPLIQVTNKDTGYELPLELVGTGIMEMIIFLTNIVTLRENVFLIEEPELHLHPSSQRSLLDFLQEYKKYNQIFLISHSPYFVNIEGIIENIVVKMKEGTSIIKQIPEDFNRREKSKIEKILDSENKEMFFSSLVLLVEGETEKGALPVFAKALNFDFDKNNIFVCWVGGKYSFKIYQRILDAYGIPHIIVCDGDAPKDIKVDKNKLTILDPDFEGVLEKYKYGNLLREAKREVGESKPRKGKYVAKKVIEMDKEIPAEFKKIIEKVDTILKSANE